MAIIKQMPEEVEKEILLVDAFLNAAEVAGRFAKCASSIGSVRYFKTLVEAYRFAERSSYNQLFIDSDVGLRKYFDLLRLKIRHPFLEVAVYEEGLGTYRNDLYGSFKSFFYRAFGVGAYFGGSCFTRAIYVYSPDEYTSRFSRSGLKVFPIAMSVSDVAASSKRVLEDIFDISSSVFDEGDLTRNTCVFYLTSWVVCPDFLKKLSETEGGGFIKLHPHIKGDDFSRFSRAGFHVVPSHVPAEIFILEAAKRFGLVKVFHHGSSVVRYISMKNVVFIDAVLDNPRNVETAG